MPRRALTLIELCIAIAIICIVLGLMATAMLKLRKIVKSLGRTSAAITAPQPAIT
jgi:prepilin-type N-terminal cleavage/methylation domain-containing protein